MEQQGLAPVPQEQQVIPPEAGQADGGNVSPEEQKMYDLFVDNAYTLIYDGKTFPSVIKALGATDDPIVNLANAATSIVMRLKDSAEESGNPVSNDVIMHGGIEIIEDLADTAEKAGMNTYSEKDLEAAAYRAFDMYREFEESQGKTDKDAAMQDIQMIKQAEADGSLGDFFGKAPEGEQPEAQPVEEQPEQGS